MSHYKPYPAYKDSGVEWLGKVPEHWEVLPLRAVASVNDDEREQSTESDGSIRYIDISTVSLEEGIGEPTVIEAQDAPSRAQRKAKTGDVVISTVRTYLRTIGQVHHNHEDCIFSTGFAVIRAGSKIAPEFLYSGLLSEPLLAEIEANSKGVSYPAINASEVMLFKLPVPPKLEQVRITEVLKRETTRIDALISKKTRFIELLREKRQALITHAVTKGLDPNVKMKDSGVEWLGEVPEHWVVSKLKHNLREQLSYGANEAAEQDDPENPRFIRITDLNDDGTLRSETFKSLPWDAARPYLLEDGDVLLARSGATVGKSFLYKKIMGLACYAGYLIRARFDKNKILPRYFWYITNSSYYWDFISGSNIQSTIQNVSGEKYGNLWIATPPLKEQERVIIGLDSVWTRIQSIIDRTEKSIELLKERRSALITAAVTGQIDLREAVDA